MTGLGCMALGAEGYVDQIPRAVRFSGQGSQTVGMGKWVYDTSPAAREVHDLADQIAGWPWSRLCLSGSESELIRTQNLRPALFATCLAMYSALGLQRRCDRSTRTFWFDSYTTIDKIEQRGYQEE